MTIRTSPWRMACLMGFAEVLAEVDFNVYIIDCADDF